MQPDAPAPQDTRLTAPGDTRVIPVLEEQVQIERQVVETGKVLLHKTVHTTEQLVEIPLLQQGYHIDRVPVGTFVETAPAVRQEGDTLIYPVLEEVLVVEKRLRLVEEIRVTPQQTTRQYQETVTLRREEITTDRQAGPASFERPA